MSAKNLAVNPVVAATIQCIQDCKSLGDLDALTLRIKKDAFNHPSDWTEENRKPVREELKRRKQGLMFMERKHKKESEQDDGFN